MIRYYLLGEERKKLFSPGSDFADQIFTEELPGVGSTGVLRQGV